MFSPSILHIFSEFRQTFAYVCLHLHHFAYFCNRLPKTSLKKGDTSETSFQPLCKMAFLAPRMGHISSYSCPFDLVPSRIDSSKCPFQNGVLRSQCTFLTQNPPKMTRFWPKKAQSRPKASKMHQNGSKMMPKTMLTQPQNDPKVTPK